MGSLNSVCVFLRIRSRGIIFQYSLIHTCMGISSSYKTLKDKQQSKQNFISHLSYLYSLHVQTCILHVSGNVLLLSQLSMGYTLTCSGLEIVSETVSSLKILVWDINPVIKMYSLRFMKLNNNGINTDGMNKL